MSYGRIVISSGHGLKVRGASGIIDEVDEARKVVEAVAVELQSLGVEVTTYHDNTSTSQSENLDRIVDFHNAQSRDLDISIHFNAYVETEKGMGVEVLYYSQSALAAEMAAAIASCGFINRGGKKRTDLAFLNGCQRPAILIEVCFVDSETDTDIYAQQFDSVCRAIAEELAGAEEESDDRPDVLTGEVSWFGGPDDDGVAADEDLAFIYDVEDAPYLFLATQPPGTTGLARRLNPNVPYIALRFDYDVHPKNTLVGATALVRATKTGRQMLAFAADWGPHVDTGRVADISPGLMTYLGIQTDDEVEVIFPFKKEDLDNAA